MMEGRHDRTRPGRPRHHFAPRGRVARALATLLLAGGTLVACQVQTNDDTAPRDGQLPLHNLPQATQVPAPLAGAHCSISVDGQGVLDIEEDYLPHVIQCENGGANLEALKAQAIAARSVAYYAIETSGSICDSQGCQVYSCGNTPQAIHHQAVEETSGQYLMFNSTLTYGFYVAGDPATPPPACMGDVNVGTEHWVTYNEGQSGFDVEQTELGFVHAPGDPGYGQNRGCMSQWGARCLENDNGYDHDDILRFYYGADVEVIQAEGACVMPLPGEGDSSTGDVPGDDTTGAMTGSDPDPESTGSPSTDGPGPDPDTGDDGLPPGGTAADTDSADDPADGSVDDGVDPALPTTFGQNDGEGSCACRSTESGGGGGWWMWLGVLLWRRRRR